MFPSTTRVLIVDDAISMRVTVKNLLTGFGLTDVVEAANGNQAWSQLTTSETPIGLILSDHNMPECTGLEFLKRVRADEKYKALPFIMVTSETDKSTLLEAIKCGVTAYVNKPLQPEDLKKKIEYSAAKAGIK